MIFPAHDGAARDPSVPDGCLCRTRQVGPDRIHPMEDPAGAGAVIGMDQFELRKCIGTDIATDPFKPLLRRRGSLGLLL